MNDVVAQFATEKTRRVWQLVWFLALQERQYLRRSRRKLWTKSALLGLILGLEYWIGFGFISDLLADGDSIVATAFIALVVPVTAFAAHLLIQEGQKNIARRLRTYAITGVSVLPIAMSLGLAVSMAANLISYGSGSGGTIGGQQISIGVGGSGITETVLTVLGGLSPLLLVVAYGSALGISFYIAHRLFISIEVLSAKVSAGVDRFHGVEKLFKEFMCERHEFERDAALRRRLMAKMPSHPNERFADELAVLVNHELAQMRRQVQQHRPGGVDDDPFTQALDRRVHVPPHIGSLDEALRVIAEIRDKLRPHAVVAALGAAPT